MPQWKLGSISKLRSFRVRAQLQLRRKHGKPRERLSPLVRTGLLGIFRHLCSPDPAHLYGRKPYHFLSQETF